MNDDLDGPIAVLTEAEALGVQFRVEAGALQYKPSGLVRAARIKRHKAAILHYLQSERGELPLEPPHEFSEAERAARDVVRTYDVGGEFSAQSPGMRWANEKVRSLRSGDIRVRPGCPHVTEPQEQQPLVWFLSDPRVVTCSSCTPVLQLARPKGLCDCCGQIDDTTEPAVARARALIIRFYLCGACAEAASLPG